MTSEKKKFFGYKAVVAAVVVSFLMGMNFGGYSLCIQFLMDKFGASATAAGLGGSFETYACCIVSIFFAGFIIKKLGAKRTILISGVICGLYAFVYIFAPNLTLIYIFEVFVGASQAIGYITGMNAFISKWFIDKRETVIGVAYACVGFGGAAGVAALGALQSSVGLEAGGWVFALAAVVAIVTYIFFLKNPEDVGQKPLGWEHAAEIAEETGSDDSEQYGVGFKGALKSPSFYLMLAAVVIWGLAIVVYNYQIVIFTSGNISDLTASQLNSLGFICLAIISIIAGKATEKFGMAAYAVVAFGSAILGLAFMALWMSSGAFGLAVVAEIFLGGGYSIGGTMGGMLCTKMFGTKDFEKITPIVYAMRSIGLGTSVMVLPALADSMGTWLAPCWMGVGMLAVALVITLVAIALAPMRKLLKESGVEA